MVDLPWSSQGMRYTSNNFGVQGGARWYEQLVHLWRKVSRGAGGLKTVLSVLLMRAARTFQLLLTPSDLSESSYCIKIPPRSFIENSRRLKTCKDFKSRMTQITQTSSEMIHWRSTVWKWKSLLFSAYPMKTNRSWQKLQRTERLWVPRSRQTTAAKNIPKIVKNK